MKGPNRIFGHTLVEILMVVLILGILVYIPITRFDTYRKQSAARATKANIENIRMAAALFYENENMWPYNDLSNLVTGGPSGAKYLGKIPEEAVTGKNGVYNTGTVEPGGWLWDTTNHTIRPNLTGMDAFGIPYYEY